MSTAAAYRKATRRTVKICGGQIEVEIRSLSAADFLEAFGSIPILFEIFSRPARNAKAGTQQKDAGDIAGDPTALAKMNEALICRGVCGPGNFRIVPKPPSECVGDELSMYELSAEDSSLIANEVTSLSDFISKEAGKALPFPEKAESAPTS